MDNIRDRVSVLPPSSRDTSVEDRVRSKWEFISSYKFPVPAFDVYCPQCRLSSCDECDNKDVYLRHYSYHTSENTRNPSGPIYRCDVLLKCHCCSHCLNPFGVVLFDEEGYKKAKKHSPIRYDKVIELLEREGW